MRFAIRDMLRHPPEGFETAVRLLTSRSPTVTSGSLTVAYRYTCASTSTSRRRNCGEMPFITVTFRSSCDYLPSQVRLHFKLTRPLLTRQIARWLSECKSAQTKIAMEKAWSDIRELLDRLETADSGVAASSSGSGGGGSGQDAVDCD